MEEISVDNMYSKLQVREINPWKRLYFERRFISERTNTKVLYIHTPFCKSKCKYCVYSSCVPRTNDEIDFFVEKVIPKQIELYHDVFENVMFDQVYFGGGTPSILTTDQLSKIFDNIPYFDSIENKCIEASPATITSEHIKLFSDRHFSFLSVGVQSLDNKTLEKYSRPFVSIERLEEICDEVRETDIFLNLDLICYLNKGDIRDIPKFEEELRIVLERFRPHSVTIHQYYQSFFTTEKTYYLLEVLRRVIQDSKEYCFSDDSYELESNEIVLDTYKQAEYRLVRHEKNKYRHYMWDKYATIPVEGYDILSLGYTAACHTTSNVDKMVYVATNDTLVYSV